MKFVKKYIFFNFLTWTAVALLDLAGDYFYESLWDRPFQWLEEIPFITSWYTWFLLTPPAIWFARKFNYANTHVLKFILLHASMYLVLNAVQVILATWHITIVSSMLTADYPFQGIFNKTAVSGSFYNFFIYGIIVLVINMIKYYGALQKERTRSLELENKLTESRMEFLKQQLQPHFLFNTHHSVITLMRLGQTKKAIEMMEKLSDLMRFALKESKSQEVPLRKEIELLQLYVDIQKIRFEDHLSVHINVPDHLKNALVPTMILQPLVENSIKYAIEESKGSGIIDVEVNNGSGQLSISIRDEGSSLPHPMQKGIGISNTAERLHKLYGDAQSFSIHQHTDAHPGFKVMLKIPLHYA